LSDADLSALFRRIDSERAVVVRDARIVVLHDRAGWCAGSGVLGRSGAGGSSMLGSPSGVPGPPPLLSASTGMPGCITTGGECNIGTRTAARPSPRPLAVAAVSTAATPAAKPRTGNAGPTPAPTRGDTSNRQDRVQRLPIPADKRHRRILIRIGSMLPQLDPGAALERRTDQQFIQPMLHPRPLVRGRLATTHQLVRVPHLQARPLPIRGREELPFDRLGSAAHKSVTSSWASNPSGGCSSPGPATVGSATPTMRFSFSQPRRPRIPPIGGQAIHPPRQPIARHTTQAHGGIFVSTPETSG